jgi:hypothetical protein
MFGLAKNPLPGLALLTLIPAFLILSYFCFARSTGAPAHAPERITRAEPELNVDLDHDGLPDIIELRTFNDRENFRRWFTWVAEMQFYNLSDQVRLAVLDQHPDKRWRPISTNQNFLGFYRLKILNQQLTPEKRT